jgi:HD-like signal output (HDOD) protein/CheY-like chemotaxis protein
MSKTRVLFVDDEADLLASLRVALRRDRAEFDMTFLDNAKNALQLLETQPFDVVVSDMRMPGMDGATFLREVRKLHPDSVRVVLSGQADEQMAMRAIPVAHQWLHKPCEREVLLDTLRRAMASRQSLQREELRRIVGATAVVPSVPHLYAELMEAMARPDTGLDAIAQVIGRDPGMASKILQLANSALFGRTKPLLDVQGALALLGLRTIAHLVLAVELFEVLRAPAAEPDIGLRVERRALQLSRLTGRMLQADPQAATIGATVGLLHEVGALVMLRHDGGGYLETRRLVAADAIDIATAERRVFGATHAEVGAAVLGSWGLPIDIVDVILNHHDLQRWQAHADVGAALHLAEVLVDNPAALPALESAVAAHGHIQRFQEWQRSAMEMVT